MEKNKNIKELWNRQAVPAVAPSIVFKRIKDFRHRRIMRTLLLSIILLLTITFVVFVWIFYKPLLLSTKVGIILTVLSVSFVLLFNLRLLPLYRKLNENQSNQAYLIGLLAVRKQEIYMQTKLLNLYFLLLSAGISLYMYEYIMSKSVMYQIVSYSVLFLWIGINWFYLRPLISRKNKQKINDLIKQVEKITEQLFASQKA